MTTKAVTRVSLVSEGEDPLESVRRVLTFLDEISTIPGVKVEVTGDLSVVVRLTEANPVDDPEVPSGGPD